MRGRKDKPMDKSGTAELVGIILALGMVILGGITSYKILSENRYVGDKTTLLVYDLSKCDISHIPRENITSFNDLEGAKAYALAECSK